MKKERIANMLLKGAIVGVGTVLGLGISKLFHVEVEETEVGTDGETTSEPIEGTYEWKDEEETKTE